MQVSKDEQVPYVPNFQKSSLREEKPIVLEVLRNISKSLESRIVKASGVSGKMIKEFSYHHKSLVAFPIEIKEFDQSDEDEEEKVVAQSKEEKQMGYDYVVWEEDPQESSSPDSMIELLN